MGVDPADMVPIKSNLNVAHTMCADCWQSQSLQVCDFNIKHSIPNWSPSAFKEIKRIQYFAHLYKFYCQLIPDRLQ